MQIGNTSRHVGGAWTGQQERRSRNMILQGYKHYHHSCCDVCLGTYSKRSIGEGVPDLIFECKPDRIYSDGFILETTERAPIGSFLFREESFVMSNHRGFIMELILIV